MLGKKATARTATALTTIGLLVVAAPATAGAQTTMQCAFDASATQMNTPFPPPAPSAPAFPPSGAPAPPALPSPPNCPPPAPPSVPALPGMEHDPPASSSASKPKKSNKKKKHKAKKAKAA
jgi:hypothetical protein